MKRTDPALLRTFMGDSSSFEIYLNDLKEEVQKEFLKFMGMSSPEEGNFDSMPIAAIPKGEPDEID
jgi:hypothetical protein